MAYDEDLAERIRELIAPQRGTAEVRMFGGICFMLNGNMACGVLKDDLLVRVGADAFAKMLEAPGTKPMDMMKGRTPVGFVMVEPSATRTKQQLQRWVSRGVDYASSLPPKAAKARKTAARTTAKKARK